MSGNVYLLCAIGVVAAVTWALRAIPFVLLGGRKLSDVVVYLGKVLPAAIMAILVVYCLRNLDLLGAEHGLRELIPVGLVVGLHLWRGNTLLSIAAGTAAYMALIRL